jgi:hypothetical protein
VAAEKGKEKGAEIAAAATASQLPWLQVCGANGQEGSRSCEGRVRWAAWGWGWGNGGGVGGGEVEHKAAATRKGGEGG